MIRLLVTHKSPAVLRLDLGNPLNGAVVLVVPTVDPEFVTPMTEAFQAVVWHLLVSHPALKTQRAHWESLAPNSP